MHCHPIYPGQLGVSLLPLPQFPHCALVWLGQESLWSGLMGAFHCPWCPATTQSDISRARPMCPHPHLYCLMFQGRSKMCSSHRAWPPSLTASASLCLSAPTSTASPSCLAGLGPAGYVQSTAGLQPGLAGDSLQQQSEEETLDPQLRAGPNPHPPLLSCTLQHPLH